MSIFKQPNGRYGWKDRTPPRPRQHCTCGAAYWVQRSLAETCEACGEPLGAPVMERRQVKRQGYSTRKAAAKAERDFLDDIDKGRDPIPADITFRDWATEWLCSDHVRSLADSTAATYENYLTNRIMPVFGDMKLVDIRARHVRKLKEDSALTLSASTVNQILAVVGLVLKSAVEAELVPFNVRREVSRARLVRPELVVPTAAQVTEIESQAAGTMWETPVHLATLGVRRAENVGLTWPSVDLDTGTISITQTLQRVRNGDGTRSLAFVPPKTPRSRRTFSLPRRTLDHLRAHRRDQAERQIAVGSLWQRNWNLVSDAGDGGPIDPDSFSNAFRSIATRAGHPDVRLHDMRHSAATTMLRQGVNPAVVSAVLGHADVGFTMSTYVHVTAGDTASAAAALDRAFTIDSA